MSNLCEPAIVKLLTDLIIKNKHFIYTVDSELNLLSCSLKLNAFKWLFSHQSTLHKCHKRHLRVCQVWWSSRDQFKTN